MILQVRARGLDIVRELEMGAEGGRGWLDIVSSGLDIAGGSISGT